jgi:hypothetical protein
MISKFIKPGTVSTVPYNHYSKLKSIEDIVQIGHLGYAGQAGLVGFGSDIFTNLQATRCPLPQCDSLRAPARDGQRSLLWSAPRCCLLEQQPRRRPMPRPPI